MFKSVKYLDGAEEVTDDIVRPGKVLAKFQNGDTFEGEYETTQTKGLIRTGKGVYTWSSGAKYDGDYKDGKRHGHGVYTFPSGEIYEGNWENGVKFGKGVYKYTNGDIFYGEWVGDKRNGDGKFVNVREKLEITGTWKNGHLIESTVQKKAISEPAKEEVQEEVVTKTVETVAPVATEAIKEEEAIENIDTKEEEAPETKDDVEEEKKDDAEEVSPPPKIEEAPETAEDSDPVETLEKQEAAAEEATEEKDEENAVKDMPEVEDPEKAEEAVEEKDESEDVEKTEKAVEEVTLNEETAQEANAPENLDPSPASKPMFIIITGAPASGKGTQCENIARDFGVVHLSTGDILRDAVKNGTEHGKKAKEYMDKGELVPDEVVNEIVRERLAMEDVQKQGVLLDGYPRTPAQAQELKDNGIDVDACLLLEVPDDVVVARAIGRQLDPETGKIYHMEFNPAPDDIKSRLITRADDTKEKMEERLVHYKRNLANLKEFYTEVLHTVDGNKDHPIVWDDIKEILVEVEKNKAGESA